MTESRAPSDAAAKPQSKTTSTFRLVIRAEIIPEEPRPPVPQRLSRRVLALALGAIALLVLGWVGFSVFKNDPTTTPAASEGARDVESQLPAAPAATQAAPVGSAGPAEHPATATAATGSAEVTPIESRSTGAKSVEPEVREPDAPPSPVNQVIPNVPRSALQTIRGTIRVSVRVIVDEKGTVLAATATDPGPSRYFERLAIEASKKWTFAPTNRDEQRLVLVQFNFTRAGTTARIPLHPQ